MTTMAEYRLILLLLLRVQQPEQQKIFRENAVLTKWYVCVYVERCLSDKHVWHGLCIRSG